MNKLKFCELNIGDTFYHNTDKYVKVSGKSAYSVNEEKIFQPRETVLIEPEDIYIE